MCARSAARAGRSAARVVLLGGSNLSRGFSTIVEIARRTAGSPTEFLVAAGHGRSYGKRSTVLGRSLPGIAECGLWDALDGTCGPPTFALVTDIGNDVVYGASVDTIAGWVELCLDRLTAHGARIVLTLLPMESLACLSRWRFEVARGILFPGKRISMTYALECAHELNERLRGLGADRGVRLIEQERGWYGLDPIHITQRRLKGVWAHILSAWVEEGGDPVSVRRSVLRWARLRVLTPQQWWILGMELGRPQPAGRLPDGTSFALY